MRTNSIIGVTNNVAIAFTKRKMTAYGGFALLASFFERIGFARMIEKAIPISERSPNGRGIYGKSIAFMAMVIAGAERFSHLVYLGNKDVLAKIFGVKRLPDAATTITRMFNKLTTLKAANTLSYNVWAYLCQLIPWTVSKKTGLPLTRPYFFVMGNRKEQRRDTTRSNTVDQATVLYLPFLTEVNT
jgi:hypothetical protein